MRTEAVACILAATLAVASAGAMGTPIVYVPINPAFGGNPLMAPGLLNMAQATNKHRDASLSSVLSKTPLQQFSDMLERSVLSQLSAAATSNVIANGQLKPGSVETGNFRIDIVDLGGGVLQITTTDKVTGDSTSFQVGGQGQ